jgi:hypothetical protein
MDNLLFANGAPPGKLNFQGCTPGYPASRFDSGGNWSTDSADQEKVAQFRAESVDHFTAECLVQFGPERVAQFAAESVAGWLRNPQVPKDSPDNG